MKKTIAGIAAGLALGGGAMLAIPSHAAAPTGAPQCSLHPLGAWLALQRISYHETSSHPARTLKRDARLAGRTLDAGHCR